MYSRLISDPTYVSTRIVRPIYRAEPGSSKYRCKLNDVPAPEMLGSKDSTIDLLMSERIRPPKSLLPLCTPGNMNLPNEERSFIGVASNEEARPAGEFGKVQWC